MQLYCQKINQWSTYQILMIKLSKIIYPTWSTSNLWAIYSIQPYPVDSNDNVHCKRRFCSKIWIWITLRSFESSYIPWRRPIFIWSGIVLSVFPLKIFWLSCIKKNYLTSKRKMRHDSIMKLRIIIRLIWIKMLIRPLKHLNVKVPKSLALA